MTNILAALLIFAVALMLILPLLIALWKRTGDHISATIFCLVFLGSLIQVVPGMGWCIALLPPLNNPVNPYIVGVGGAAYGLDYEVYPLCAAFFSLSALFCVLTGFLFLRRKRNHVYRPFASLRNKINSKALVKLAGISVLCALVYLVISYSLLGWNSLWKVNLVRDDFVGRSLGLIDYRAFVVGAFILSLPMLGVCMIGNLYARCLAAVSVLLFALPSIALGSRRGTLLLISLVAILCLRSRFRVWLIVPAIALSLFIYTVPLVMRAEQGFGTGLYYVFKTIELISNPAEFPLDKQAVRLLCNLGQGFAVFAEFAAQEEMGQDILAQAPPFYHLISISPFPSLIDGYQSNYLPYHARINIYSPYSAYAELASFSWVLSSLCSAALVMVAAFLVSAFRNVRGLGWWFGFAAVAGAMLTLAHLQQYNLRQATRFFVYPADIALVALCFYKLTPPRGRVVKTSAL